MVITIDILYSKHALEKIDAFGLELEDLEKVIMHGMKWQKNDKWHASMAGLECVFIKQNDSILLITVYKEGD